MLCLISISGFSQNNKQASVFNDLPKVINCSESEFEAIFKAIPGSFAKITMSDKFTFGGKIVYNEVKYSNLQSVAIQSPHYDNAVFSLSRQINKDNSITYVGRILKMGAPDGYELNRSEKGNYTLNKIVTTDIVQVCL